MLRLVPMTEAEFDGFMELSMRDQAEGHVQAGTWRADEADAQIRELRAQFLPDGLDTPNHHFFTLAEGEAGAKVGGLWFTVIEQEGERQVFVVDIQVYDAYRRRGFGTQAFRLMEGLVRELGITTVALHVFQHNHPARAMYEKLGYTGSGAMMSKDLSTAE